MDKKYYKTTMKNLIKKQGLTVPNIAKKAYINYPAACCVISGKKVGFAPVKQISSLLKIDLNDFLIFRLKCGAGMSDKEKSFLLDYLFKNKIIDL